MTGFARREVSGPWGTIVCELRSVNHRFLETGFRLPDELRSAEGELRARLAREVRRGKVDCVMSYRRTQGGAAGLELDPAALDRLLQRLREVAAAVAGARTAPPALDLLDLLRWPGVLREESSGTEALLAAAH